MATRSVLIIERDDRRRAHLAAALSREGYLPLVASDASAALEALAAGVPGALVVGSSEPPSGQRLVLAALVGSPAHAGMPRLLFGVAAEEPTVGRTQAYRYTEVSTVSAVLRALRWAYPPRAPDHAA